MENQSNKRMYKLDTGLFSAIMLISLVPDAKTFAPQYKVQIKIRMHYMPTHLSFKPDADMTPLEIKDSKEMREVYLDYLLDKGLIDAKSKTLVINKTLSVLKPLDNMVNVSELMFTSVSEAIAEEFTRYLFENHFTDIKQYQL